MQFVSREAESKSRRDVSELESPHLGNLEGQGDGSKTD